VLKFYCAETYFQYSYPLELKKNEANTETPAKKSKTDTVTHWQPYWDLWSTKTLKQENTWNIHCLTIFLKYGQTKTLTVVI